MPGLLSLSAELLVQIFAAGDAICDTLQLSATNRHLRDIWLEHSDVIIDGVLKPSIPGYKAATNLAVTESMLKSSIDHAPPLRRCLPSLLRNANLCNSACSAYSKSCEDDPSPARSYYFLRRVGLGFLYHQFRDELCLEVQAMPREPLAHASRMSYWLLLKADDAEQIRQGVKVDESGVWDVMKDTDTAWDYANYVVSNGAIADLDRGTNNLPLTTQG